MLFEKIGVIDENFDYQSDMYVLTQGDRITYVGKTRPDGEFSDIYDGTNKVLLPGFVNAHTHSTMTLLRRICRLSVGSMKRFFRLRTG